MPPNPTSQVPRGTKRILIFSIAYFPVEGGAEIAVKEITGRIPESEIEWDIITLRFDGAHQAKEKIGNCTVYRIDSSKTLFPFKAFFLAKSLHKTKPYEAIWAVMANWAGLAALFFKHHFPFVPYILTLQEGDSIEDINHRVRFIYPLFKKVFLSADIIQTISKYLSDWAKAVGYKGRIEIIPNGVDVERFLNPKSRILNQENVILITTSRLVEKNAVGDIISAIALLPETVSLKVLGIGPLESELRNKVRQLNLDTRVQFLGHVPYDEIPKYLHEADIFVRPSLSEGFGNSFIEAMAAGLPVIATPVGGIVDFLKDGENGLFCEVHNPESIARQVTRLLEDEKLRLTLTENAKNMVKEKYGWDLVAKEMKARVFDKV